MNQRPHLSDRTTRPTEIARNFGIPVTLRMRAAEAEWAKSEACQLLGHAESFEDHVTHRNLDDLNRIEAQALAERLEWVLDGDVFYFEKSLLLAQQLYSSGLTWR